MTVGFSEEDVQKLCDLASLPEDPPEVVKSPRGWRSWNPPPQEPPSLLIDLYLGKIAQNRSPTRPEYAALARHLAASYLAWCARDPGGFGYGPHMSKARLKASQSDALRRLADAVDSLGTDWSAVVVELRELCCAGIFATTTDGERCAADDNQSTIDAAFSLANVLREWAGSVAGNPPPWRSLPEVSEHLLVPDWSAVSNSLADLSSRLRGVAAEFNTVPVGRDEIRHIQNEHLVGMARLFAHTPGAESENAGRRLIKTWQIVIPNLRNIDRIVAAIQWDDLHLSSIKPRRTDIRNKD